MILIAGGLLVAAAVGWFLLRRHRRGTKVKEDDENGLPSYGYDLEGGGDSSGWGGIPGSSPNPDFRRRFSGYDTNQSQAHSSSYHAHSHNSPPNVTDQYPQQQQQQLYQQPQPPYQQQQQPYAGAGEQPAGYSAPPRMPAQYQQQQQQQAAPKAVPPVVPFVMHHHATPHQNAAMPSPPRQQAVPYPHQQHQQRAPLAPAAPRVVPAAVGQEFPIVDIVVPPAAFEPIAVTPTPAPPPVEKVGGVPLPQHQRVVRPMVERAENGLRGSLPVMPVNGLVPKPALQNCSPPPQQQQQQNNALPPASTRTKMREKVLGFASVAMAELNLQHVLGSGAFGQVWKGQWRGTPVAVKVLTSVSQQAIPQSVMEDFEDEITILARMRHPNICLFMAACLDSDNKAIVTELVSRGSVWDVLRNPAVFTEHRSVPHASKPHWPWWAMRRVLDGTLRGLVYLHSHDPPIIHRDLKSANLLLDDSFNVKICDFGLARLRDLTQVMTAKVGTVQWMAPEVLKGVSYTESADIYSTGIIAWELLTGKCPFQGQNQLEVAQAVTLQHARPPMPPCCGPALQHFLSNAWDATPANRFTALAALQLLEKSIPI